MAHGKQCKLAFSPGVPGLMATSSEDQTVKVWDARTLQPIAQRDMNSVSTTQGQLMCLEFYKDSPYILAVGGTKGGLGIWDTEENAEVAAAFPRM